MLATLGTLGAGLGVALLLQKGVNVATYALDPVADSHLIPGVSNLVVIAIVVVVARLHRHAHVRLRPAHAGDRLERGGGPARRPQRAATPAQGLHRRRPRRAGSRGFLSLAYFTTTSVGGHTTDNLQAITAVALGGTSLFGGVATILGTVIGVWIPAVLQNGFIIVGVNPYWQLIAVGVVLVIAVALDQLRRRGQNRR